MLTGGANATGKIFYCTVSFLGWNSWCRMLLVLAFIWYWEEEDKQLFDGVLTSIKFLDFSLSMTFEF